MGKRIAGLGLTTMTGGGPGIMEAANRGAFENGGVSVGCNIRLPSNKRPIPHLTQSITFEHFLSARPCSPNIPTPSLSCQAASGPWMSFLKPLTLVQTRTITGFPDCVVWPRLLPAIDGGH